MPDLSDYVVAPSDTIQHAMEKIDRNGMRAAIVVEEEKVVGTASDGDRAASSDRDPCSRHRSPGSLSGRP